MKKPIMKELFMMFLIGILCASCDTEPWIKLEKYNYGLTKTSTDPMDQHVEGWYCEVDHKFYAILECKATVPIGSRSWHIFCLQKECVPSEGVSYRLNDSVALAIRRSGSISERKVLTNEGFIGEQLSSNIIRIRYNGEIPSRKSDEYSQFSPKWLRFDVELKENKEALITVVKNIHSMLEKGESESTIMECIAPLVNEPLK